MNIPQDRVIRLVAASTIVLAVALGCDKPSSDAKGDGASASTPAAPALKVAASEVLDAYSGNEVAADSKYKDKTIEVTGVVGDIKKDIMDDIYVTIGTGKQFELPEIQCFIADGLESKAGGLKKGQKLTVTGKVDGLMMNVLVKDCRF